MVLTPHQYSSLSNPRSVPADIKETPTAAITDLWIDIQWIAGRVQEVEKVTAQQSMAIRQAHHILDTHTLQLRDLNRHMEDLDNQGRRHNLRLRGLPETVDADHLQADFNSLLERPPSTPIGIKTHPSRPTLTKQRIRSTQGRSLLHNRLPTQGGDPKESPQQNPAVVQRR